MWSFNFEWSFYIQVLTKTHSTFPLQYEENKGKKSKSSSETKPRKPRKKYARTAAAKSYQCESCGKTFEHKQGWARHMQKHVGEPGVEIPGMVRSDLTFLINRDSQKSEVRQC